MIIPEEKQCNIYFDPLLLVWAKVLADEIYNESIDSKSMDIPESELWYQGEQPITIMFLKRGQIKIWSNRAIKRRENSMFMTNKEKIKACIFRADAGRARSCKSCKVRDICQPEEVLKEQDAAEDQEWGTMEERMAVLAEKEEKSKPKYMTEEGYKEWREEMNESNSDNH